MVFILLQRKFEQSCGIEDVLSTSLHFSVSVECKAVRVVVITHYSSDLKIFEGISESPSRPNPLLWKTYS
jgi:hypothetical protein